MILATQALFEDKTIGYNKPVPDGTPLSEVKHNRLSTVHPNLILRTQIFTPVARNPHNKHLSRSADVSDTMRELAFARAEGYKRVTIYGAVMDIETDFRVWTGITQVFEQHGFKATGMEIDFRMFASLCGFPSKQLTTALRHRIDNSLTRIMTQVITFSAPDGSKFKTHLLQLAEFDARRDVLRLVPDKCLWELYRIDHNILLSMELQESLRRKEVAQCLYMFIAALPADPAPLSFARLRERVALTTSKLAEANRSITKALTELKAIGYLDYDIQTRGRERFVLIHSRQKPTRTRQKK
jgi:hypothetical protein